MSDYTGVLAGFFVFVLFLLAVIVLTLKCHSRWDNTGYTAKWKPFSGCRVEVDGKLIHENNVVFTVE